MTPRYFAFAPFCLDVVDERLWRHEVNVQLGHKAFAVLARLVSKPNQLVTKDDLLAAAWPDTSVSEAVLTTAVREIRAAVGDTARTPRFVQTVYGRGYRFIAPVTETLSRLPLLSSGMRNGIVGREAELARLAAWYADVRHERRRVGFIAGEAGIGKTSLVDAFVASIGSLEPVQILRGQCIEQYGAGEAYLPVLEALGRLGGDPDSRAAHTLRDRAPSWLAHLPSIAAQAERALPVPPARMLRELTEALEALAALEPLVLILEDLHWSDDATLEWVEYVARRRGPTRLLVLGTYRPVESLLQRRRLRDVLTELRHQPQCGEVVLDYLDGDAVRSYVRQQTGDLPGLERLVEKIYRRTGGHPLFLAGIVEQMIQARARRDGDGAGIHLPDAIPMNVRQFIERRLEQLRDEDQSIIEAASVAGESFSVAAVAAAAALPGESVEARCEVLTRAHRLFTPNGVAAWPDGTIAASYAFRHALFHEIAYARVSPERRLRLHLAIGMRLEAAYGANTPAVAAELAMHFEQARDPAKALLHLEQAARNAMARSAYPEAHRHLTTALAMLGALGDTAERAHREATVSLLLGQLLESTKGWGADEAARAYEKARDLSVALGDEPRWFQATWGVIAATVVRADLRRTQALSRDVLALAKRRKNRLFRMAAHTELGGTALALGRAAAARRHFRLAEALDESVAGQRTVDTFGMDIGIFTRTWSTHLMWHLGFPDGARGRAAETMAAAQAIGHPFTQTITLAYAAMLEHFCRNVAEVNRLARATIDHASEHGFPYYLAWAEILRGWSVIVGDADGNNRASAVAIAEMRRGIEVVRAIASLRLPYYRAVLAEACGRIGRTEEGLDEIARALDEARRTGECWWEPELYRLRGMLLGRAAPGRERDAESCFHTAVELARRYGARVLELRALVSLAESLRGTPRAVEACGSLSTAYAGFTEGFDTADLRDTRALLAPTASRLRRAT